MASQGLDRERNRLAAQTQIFSLFKAFGGKENAIWKRANRVMEGYTAVLSTKGRSKGRALIFEEVFARATHLFSRTLFSRTKLKPSTDVGAKRNLKECRRI